MNRTPCQLVVGQTCAVPAQSRRALRSLCAALTCLALGTAAAGTPELAAVDWQADFEALLAGLASNYANFEDQIRERRLDRRL